MDELAQRLVLCWPTPAQSWNEALPVGNGRLGAMVYGGASDHWQINDATVWSGYPGGAAEDLDRLVAGGAGPARLAEVRSAIAANDHDRATELLYGFQGRYSQEFLPFVDVWLDVAEPIATSERRLDLSAATITDTVTTAATQVVRTVRVSHPAQAIIGTLRAERPFTCTIRVSTAHPVRRLDVQADGIVMGIDVPVDGAPEHEPAVEPSLRYGQGADGYLPYASAGLQVSHDGRAHVVGDSLVVEATELIIAISGSTSAEDWWACGQVSGLDMSQHDERAADRARAALADPHWADAHATDVRAAFGGSSITIDDGTRPDCLTFDGDQAVVDIPAMLVERPDALTATVITAYGRYLLAQSSRPGSPPANLQGIWNDSMRPAWSSNYTVNINTEMNYWPVFTAGVRDVDEPLLRLIQLLSRTGADVAAKLYGARGWVCHHNTDMWGWALPVGMGHGNPSWANWSLGGAWLAEHLWQRWEYVRDEDELANVTWPVYRGLAEFFLDWLVVGPDGFLESSPSTSPENLFLVDGVPRSLTMSATMDIALIRSVFGHCLRMRDVLGLSDEVLARVQDAVALLRPFGVTADGRLREWADDLVEEDPQHRHMSHMVAVYPLGLIDVESTPQLASAAVAVLDGRGPGAMGWSWAWKIALRARLGDGESARSLLVEATTPLTGDPDRFANPDGSTWGGVLPNLFSTHPPFQIDGNYGFAAGVAEMLLQSHRGVIDLLPALPAAWSSGSVRALPARGGLEVSLRWRAGRPVSCLVARRSGDPDELVRVRWSSVEVAGRIAVGECREFGGF